jgi:hypothetical protein
MLLPGPFHGRIIMITPTKNKIMINGMHERTLGTQDWDDTSYERWGLAHHRVRYHYFDRLFESHSPEIVFKHCPLHAERMTDYVNRDFPIPLYSPWEWPEHMGVQTISHETIEEGLGGRMYWESSISFPMALAMCAMPEEIAIYGVDMSNEGGDHGGERTEQKHSMMYQIGLAEGMGIKVTIAPNSTLFDSRWTGGIYGHPKSVDDFPYQLG